jgi:hypothetical protein
MDICVDRVVEVPKRERIGCIALFVVLVDGPSTGILNPWYDDP